MNDDTERQAVDGFAGAGGLASGSEPEFLVHEHRLVGSLLSIAYRMDGMWPVEVDNLIAALLPNSDAQTVKASLTDVARALDHAEAWRDEPQRMAGEFFHGPTLGQLAETRHRNAVDDARQLCLILAANDRVAHENTALAAVHRG